MRQRREALGLSQGRLGRELGVTFSQVQKYEKGANRIGAGRLYVLASLLGVPVQYFFDELGDSQSTRNLNGTTGAKDAELAMLDDAYRSIADRETRRSLLALARSLATSAHSPTHVRSQAS